MIKKWEYKIVDMGTSQIRTLMKSLDKRMTELGEQGWELVCAVPVRSALLGGNKFEQRYVFKRELK